ncbi:cyclic nucleotide-binding domain-containing protein [bacterium]|nr:cyclic nucleotide-binding domain-containing protein [bacterium]MBU1651775.1 cyclic nucleotide-binding domain-containing protein [bacterium]MBU1881588.1 cyclic nucleotide-binding domain-containing protein [bacterium]
MLTTIEKVITLQEIDIFQHLSTEDLAHIAAIADEVEYPEGVAIFKQGGIADSMYMILTGKVLLHQDEREVMVAGEMEAFGTWALFDDEPRVVTATTVEHSHLLCIDEEDFLDLLSDNVRITQGVMKSLVTRVRKLAAIRAPGSDAVGR